MIDSNFSFATYLKLLAQQYQLQESFRRKWHNPGQSGETKVQESIRANVSTDSRATELPDSSRTIVKIAKLRCRRFHEPVSRCPDTNSSGRISRVEAWKNCCRPRAIRVIEQHVWKCDRIISRSSVDFCTRSYRMVVIILHAVFLFLLWCDFFGVVSILQP